MTKKEMQSQALANATQNQSLMNYASIFNGFMARGIPEAEIMPRENVFTYNAWLALGRQVRKGEHGVKVVTFVDCDEKDKKTGEKNGKSYRRPWTTTVFHVSQTDAIQPEPFDLSPWDADYQHGENCSCVACIEPELDATDENVEFAGE